MILLSAVEARPGLIRANAGDRLWWLTFTALCTALLLPLLVVDMPPLLDYPNHLARAFVLASLPGDTVLARFYSPHWSLIPNLALDLIAPPLIHVLPVHVAGRLLIAAALLLPVMGTIAYNTTLGGRWWSLGVGLVAYNSCLLYGFLNFSISLGVALLLAAGWLRWRESHPVRTIALATAGALVLFACHLMGLVFFGLLLAGNELFHLFNERQGEFRRAMLTRGLTLVLIFAAPMTLYAVSALRPLGGDAGFLPLAVKLLQLITTFVNYAWPLDMTVAGVSVAVPAIGLLLGRGRVPGPAACTMVLLLLTFLAAPYAWKGTYLLDTRLAVMLGFMLFAGFVPAQPVTNRFVPRRWPTMLSNVVTATLTLLFVARMVLLITAWVSHRKDLADLRRVLEPVKAGQAVYIAEVDVQERPAYWQADPRWRKLSDGTRLDAHLGALVLIEHRAFWPFEFDMPSQQPIETREPYRTLAGRVGFIPGYAQVSVADVCGFDYVLLMEADAVPDLPAERFRLMSRSGFAALYTITTCK